MKMIFNVLSLCVGVLLLICFEQNVIKAQTIQVFDLGYTLEGDYNDPKIAIEAWEHNHVVSSIQGILNRNQPTLYTFFVKRGDVNIDRYWWNKYRQKGAWLSNKDTVVYDDVCDLIMANKDKINGVVVYDPKIPATSNVASAVSGIEGLIAIRYNLDENSLYHKLVKSELLPVKCWLINEDGTSLFTGEGTIIDTHRPSSGSAKNDVYQWFIEKYIKTGKCNTEFGAYYIDQEWLKSPTRTSKNHHTLSNHDYFISKKGFFFDLSPWADEPSTDDKSQKLGSDLSTLKEFLLLAYKQNENGKRFTHIGGFPPWAFKYTKHAQGKHEDVETEWEYSKIISAYNAFKDADAIDFGALSNASFWQHYPLKSEYPQNEVTKEKLVERGLLSQDGKLTDNDKVYLVFYVGDYDAASWLSQTTPSLWDDPNRGQVPMMWAISPILARRAPMAMEYRWESATPNDYFVAADNGAGYLMPGMLQEPRPISGLSDGSSQWADHNISYYKKWGLSITGFVIDGEAPGLNHDGFAAYAQFSPNGIVPQKVPHEDYLFDNMPVLKSDEDVNANDPKEAARIIVNRIANKQSRFHWFRNILKSPTWYVQVMKEVGLLNPNIELLDGGSFFALYREYLKQKTE